MRQILNLQVGGSIPSRVYMEFVAQLVEHQVVALVVVGSRPIKLPKCFNSIVVVQLTGNAQVVGWLRLLPSRLGKTSSKLGSALATPSVRVLLEALRKRLPFKYFA